MAKDLYKILGVSRSASSDEIQKAYREAARKYHPDLNPDDNAKERFQEIQSAYEVLNDPQKRQSYDRFGEAYTNRGGPGGGANPFQDMDLNEMFGQGGGAGGFADILKQFTQGGGGAHPGTRQDPRSMRGKDLQHEILVAFHTAVLGGETELSVQENRGKQKTINIKIPAGIEDGKKIRVRGQGSLSPRGGPRGDLIVTVKIGSHPHYRRNGSDLEVSVPITLEEAALGAKVDVPTPKGTISLTIPPRTSSGKRLRVRGMGIESGNGKKGDLFAEVQIVLPENLSDESIELLKQIEQSRKADPREDLKW